MSDPASSVLKGSDKGKFQLIVISLWDRPQMQAVSLDFNTDYYFLHLSAHWML